MVAHNGSQAAAQPPTVWAFFSNPLLYAQMKELLDEKEARRLRAAAAADSAAARAEFLFKPPPALDTALCSLLLDKRDAPLLYLLLNICCTTVPAAAWLFWLRPASNLPGAAFMVANYVLYLQRFMLMLHFSEHRRLFRKGYDLLNYVVPLILCPFFGVPSGMYRLHHCIMHHTEDNRQGWDLSSTEPYQRDNFSHFLCYWLRYWVLAWGELPLYAARRRRWRELAACLAAELAYLGAVGALWLYNPVATKWVFVVPFFLSSFALMFGNWSQHIFVDPQRPRSDYSLAYNCVACPDNQKTFNDGYHIVHHINSQLHWSELPGRFRDTLAKHAEHDALVFCGIGFFDVGLAVLLRRYGFLLRHLSRYSARLASMSDAELTQLLRARLAPIQREPHQQ